MKARHFIIPIVLLASCQIELEDPDYKEEVPAVEEEEQQQEQPADSVWTITIRADKIAEPVGNDGQTKALDLVNDGATLNAYWKNTETVKVYKSGGVLLGTLAVVPDSGEKPTTATLSGSITTSGLAVDDELTLLIPRNIWDYSGQNGSLTGSGSIEENYSYATATVTVSSIDGSAVTTSNATFTNQQSVYRFGFKLSGSYIDPKDFTVSAAGGELVQSLTYDGSTWTPLYGNLTVTPASAPADHFYYMALRNGSTAADTYTFILTGTSDQLYMASKGIPASVLDVPGKFISAKNITAVQPVFNPADATTDTAL